MEFILSIIAKVLNFLVNRTLPAVIVLVIGILAIVIVTRVVDAALKKSKLEKAAHSLIKSVVKVALFILLGLIVCSKLGLDVTSVVALASVLTLAVSLALQTPCLTSSAALPCCTQSPSTPVTSWRSPVSPAPSRRSA